MTLVELLISVGLFGTLSLAVAQMFVYFNAQTITLDREIALNESIREFHEYVDMDLGNVTRFMGCDCGSANCRFPSAFTDSSNCAHSSQPCGAVLATWETETSQTPIQASNNTSCNGNPDRYGCRQFRALRIVPATDTTPGVLTLENAANQAVLSRLEGVTEVNCGMNHSRLNNGFKLRVRTKVRSRNLNDSSSNDFESWMKGGQNWLAGSHREVDIEVDFRNLTHTGLHYGKTNTVRNCLTDGTASTQAETCCSGFLNASGTACSAQSTCSVAGVASTLAGSCCSHQLNGAGTLCL